MRHPTAPVILGDKYGPRAPIKVGGQTSAGFHRGQDYVPPKAGQQVPIYAIADGTVRWTSGVYNASAGIHAIIEHPGPWGLSTGRLLSSVWVGYCHLSNRSVQAGQTVREGQQIGRMGSTGLSTGVHLHLDVFDRSPFSAGSFDARIDPLALIIPNLTGAQGGADTTPEPVNPAATSGDTMLIIHTTAYAKDKLRPGPRWAIIGGGGMFLEIFSATHAAGYEKQLGGKAVTVGGPEYRRIRDSQKSQRASTWLARSK